jgi:hypothetical protein
MEPVLSWTSPETALLSSPPRSLYAVLRNHGRSPTWAGDVIIPVTPSSSLSPWRYAPHTVPKPMMPSTLCHACARNAIVLCEPTRPSSPWRYRSRAVPEPVMPSLRHPRACDTINPTSSMTLQHHRPPRACNATLYIFLCDFGPTNHKFDMLHCHIALICCIAFVLLHCFNMLHCHIALMCYISFVLLHCFDMLHCHIALICYIYIKDLNGATHIESNFSFYFLTKFDTHTIF